MDSTCDTLGEETVVAISWTKTMEATYMEANVMREENPKSYDIDMKVKAILEKAADSSTQPLHTPLKVCTLQKQIQMTRNPIAKNP